MCRWWWPWPLLFLPLPWFSLSHGPFTSPCLTLLGALREGVNSRVGGGRGGQGTPDNNKRRTMDDIRLCFLADAQTCLPSLPTTLSSSPSSFPSFPALLFPCRPHVPVTPNVTFHTLLVHCCIISSLTPWLLRPSLPLKRLEISTLVPLGPKSFNPLTLKLYKTYIALGQIIWRPVN